MKTVGQLMTGPVVTVASSETVAAAVQRLREHRIEGVPVIDGARLAGIVTLKDLVGQPPYRAIREVMTREVHIVPPSEPVTAAFALMERHSIGRLPVAESGAIIGIVTRSDLLRELGKLTDPLTDLPWAGALRQAASDLLKQGQEIVVLFIDLDDFGIVNKLYGHVVGDHIIKAVAGLLLRCSDPATDVVCRYAGDEFAIVTTRDLAGAEALARELREAIVQVTVPGAPPGAISGSIGIAGGKRAAERADVHYEATVDDLITMASRASTMAKRTDRHVLQGAPSMASTWTPGVTPRRLAIRRVDFTASNGRGTAVVDLEIEDQTISGRAEGAVLGTGTMRLLVEATLAAVRQVLPPGYDLALEEITRASLNSGEALNVLLVSGSPAHEEHLLGSAMFSSDPHEAAVKATMKAVNRILAGRLAAQK